MAKTTNAYDEEIRRFLKDSGYVICTHNPLDKVSHKQMQFYYNQFTDKGHKLFLSESKFFNRFKDIAYTDEEKDAGLDSMDMCWGSNEHDGFGGYAPAHSDRFEKGKVGIKIWLQTKRKAKANFRDEANLNSLISLYNAWAKKNGYPIFSWSRTDGSPGPYWSFTKALNQLGLEIAGDQYEICQIVDKNGNVKAEAIA